VVRPTSRPSFLAVICHQCLDMRFPWHHACFSLRTGEALAAPALNATSCWRVEQRDGRIFVRDKISEAGRRMPAKPRPTTGPPGHMVIIGGGAAGYAAAEMLRREGYGGGVTIVSDDTAAPYDRPNLSKDYLAGTAPEEWIPLRPTEFYIDNGIGLRLATTAIAIDAAGRRVVLSGGEELGFDKLLLATGGEPIRLQVPGADLPHVRTLRSLADSRDLIARARKGSRVVVVGASFIGLEAAAALRHREVEVHVVAPEARPMERVLGPELGDFVRQLHESHGVVFHLGHTVAAIEAERVRLDHGTAIDADFGVVGIGVRPRIQLAEQAGLAIDRGVLVDEYLETSAPGIFASGDIARWPDAYSGERLRIEHWVVDARNTH
jgi:NADPH-dependent 2,4-dienoyl-CoA reductase/sulfur reductase-like enzyme